MAKINVKNTIQNPNSEILIYQTEDGTTKISVRFENENVWLTQAQLVELYQSRKINVNEQIGILKIKNYENRKN
ncbi:MAG: hypothetical protein LBU22_14290 [Dysgonamonadaceae bacterium]|jgi:hypothetical protein|nr:hypothetical protein [Dysgonamonadaceae bacterium]